MNPTQKSLGEKKMNDEITLDYHKEYSYNCLTEKQFALFQKMHKVGDTFLTDCNNYDSDDNCYFTIGHPTDRRCDCGNRRCYFVFHDMINPEENYFSIEVD